MKECGVLRETKLAKWCEGFQSDGNVQQALHLNVVLQMQ